MLQWVWNQLSKVEQLGLYQKIKTFFSTYKKGIFSIVLALALADLTLLFVQPYLFPSKEIKKSSVPIKINSKSKTSAVDFLHTANIFHSGPIPPSLKEKSSLTLASPLSGDSQLSSLPFQLLGTIENVNPRRSIASIRASETEPMQPYFVGDEVDEKARITHIERRRVQFLNLLNNRLEHIEIPEEDNLQITLMGHEPSGERIEEEKITEPTIDGVSRVDKNKYEVTRSVINQHIKNLPDVLQQARVEPKLSADGQLLGHEFKWVQKGSIYENLGFQKGDILISVNGKSIHSEAEAQRLFQQFRTSSQFSIKVQKQSGEQRELSYNIDEDTSIE